MSAEDSSIDKYLFGMPTYMRLALLGFLEIDTENDKAQVRHYTNREAEAYKKQAIEWIKKNKTSLLKEASYAKKIQWLNEINAAVTVHINSIFHLREESILKDRLGIGCPPKTLETLGNYHGLTRERIRQIEKKSLKMMMQRNRANGWAGGLLKLYRNKIEEVIFSNRCWVAVETIEKRVNILPGEITLLCYLDSNGASWSIQRWLKKNEWTEFQGGVIKPNTISEQEFARLCDEIEGMLDSTILDVVSVSQIESVTGARPWTADILECVTGRSIERNFASKKPWRRNQKRCVAILSCFRESATWAPIGLAKISKSTGLEYRECIRIMSEYPGYFLNMYEEGWACPVDRRHLQLCGYEVGLSEEDEEDAATINEGANATVKQILASKLEIDGPSSIYELMLHLERFGYSRGSAGPILALYVIFVRLAPGLYGLRRWLPLNEEMKNALHVKIDDTTQLEHYCYARQSGVELSAYTGWTREQLLRWARIAKSNTEIYMLKSLLYVSPEIAEIASEVEISSWRVICKGSFEFCLGAPHNEPSREVIVDARNLLASILFATNAGAIGWVSINRVNGKRIDDKSAFVYLSLLVQLGVVEDSGSKLDKHLLSKNWTKYFTDVLDGWNGSNPEDLVNNILKSRKAFAPAPRWYDSVALVEEFEAPQVQLWDEEEAPGGLVVGAKADEAALEEQLRLNRIRRRNLL